MKFSFFLKVYGEEPGWKDKHCIVYFSCVAWESYSIKLNCLNQIKTECKLDKSQQLALLAMYIVYSLISYGQ